MASRIKDCSVLVVGACGYFGWRVVKWLVDETRVLPSQISGIDVVRPLPERKMQHVTYYQCDIADRDQVKNLVYQIKPKVIIHTVSPSHRLTDLNTLLRVNVEGTQNLLNAAVEEPSVQVFVYTSSASVIHDFYSDLIEADESFPLLFYPQQSQLYSHSKAAAEELVLQYNRRRKDFVVAAVRPSAMFGPKEAIMIPAIVERAKSGSARFQIGDGSSCCDFTYVDNTVWGHILAVEALLKAVQDGPNATPASLRVEGEAFIITNDIHVSFWGFSRKIGALAGHSIEDDQIVIIPKVIGLGIAVLVEWIVWITTFGTKTSSVRSGELRLTTLNRTFNISKAKERLGYRPLYSLDEGMKLAVAPLVADKKTE